MINLIGYGIGYESGIIRVFTGIVQSGKGMSLYIKGHYPIHLPYPIDRKLKYKIVLLINNGVRFLIGIVKMLCSYKKSIK